MKCLKEIADGLIDRAKSLTGQKFDELETSNITIGITTFEARFDQYFVPLLARIREYTGNEIIVAINGEHNRPFGDDYRRNVLQCIVDYARVYPLVFPQFRGLAKIWNSIIIHATHNHILMLNDDIMIDRPGFLEDISKAIRRNDGKTFLVNRSWSHFLINREEIDELGYFDERLLGIGEEDGDLTWRYIHKYGRDIASFKIKGFVNFAEETVHSYKPVNIQTHSGTKYSRFNRKFMFQEKYAVAPDGIKGMFDKPVILKDAGGRQYPHEQFYRRRKGEL
jgi:hypothetical protein